jgi:hypothetical protein
MDIFEKCGSFTYAKETMKAGLYPYFIPLSENEGSEAVYQGHRLIMFERVWICNKQGNRLNASRYRRT